jgi:RAB protein geranylgeranyltransferase component A
MSNLFQISDLFHNVSSLAKYQISFDEKLLQKSYKIEKFLLDIFPKEFIYNSNHIE